MTLALLQGSFLFAIVCAVALFRERSLPTTWSDVAGVVGQALAVSLCCVAAFCCNDRSDRRTGRRFARFASRLAQSLGLALIMLLAFYMLFPEAGFTDDPITSSLIVVVVLLPLRTVSLSVMRNCSRTERVLILGRCPLAQQLIAEIESQPRCRYVIAGVVDDGMAVETLPLRYPVLGPLEHLGKILEEIRPDRIIVALAQRRGRLPLRHLLEARVRGIVVEDAVEIYERMAGKLAIEALTPSSLLFCREFWRPRLAPALGRGVSLVVSIVGLVCLAPILGLIALAIKLDSPGPVLFVQDRVGMGGRRFRLIKFRTMHPVNGETSEWVRDNGHRITRVGRWLRKFRLDELPQFVNILRGDMDLVGPRPHPISNFELLVMVVRNVPPCGEQVPYYALRSMVRPGLTGWAQVRYRYANDVDEEIEKIRYDLYYIKHMSIWLDLRILLETVKIVFLGRGRGPRTPTDSKRGRNRGPHDGSCVALPEEEKTMRVVCAVVLLMSVFVMLPGDRAEATHIAFTPGDLFVSLASGEVQWRHPDGTLNRVLIGPMPGRAAGMAFDAAGNLYVTHWCDGSPLVPVCASGNGVEVFDPTGIPRGPYGSGYNCNPYSIRFDGAGNAYVGQADCTGDILKLDARGTLQASHDVATERGSSWIDLAGDGCTVFYTSGGPSVRRFDVCGNAQLADLNTAPLPDPSAKALRILPDGGVLLTNVTAILRLDAFGNIVQTYDVPGEPRAWAWLDLVGDGTFWVSNHSSSNLFRFDIATGQVLAGFNASPAPFTVIGVAVKP